MLEYCPKIYYIFIVRPLQIQVGQSKTKRHFGDLELDGGKEIGSNYVE
jgi:hypothetical protein